jgi:subtilisin-like proprotein convertase family protein
MKKQLFQPLRLAVICLLLVSCNGGGGGGSSDGGNESTEVGPDPLFKHQWHLKNNGQNSFSSNPGIEGFDINVDEIYKDGIQGEEIKIAVSDSGIEVTHEDLANNYISSISKNFFSSYPYTGNPLPDFTNVDDMHGTAVTGIISAIGENKKGGRGVAPKSKYGGFNYLANGVTETIDKTLLQMTGQYDIFNYSYGKDPFIYQAFENESKRKSIISTYKAGVTNLRAGKGAVYVKAAGNEFTMPTSEYYSGSWDSPIVGNSGYIESNNYPYTIIVGAVNADGLKASYSSPGSNIWISAPGGEFGTLSPAIVTTDFSGCNLGSSRSANKANEFEDGNDPVNKNCNYTSTMNGTSSATPIVSGVIALILETNPSLSWRDVKHILASTAKIIDPYTGFYNHPLGPGYDLPEHIYQQRWVKNKANYWFHNYYGFGLVDAEASINFAKIYNVDLGEYRSTINPATEDWYYNSGEINLDIPNNSSTGVSSSINLKHNLVIESVQIKVSIDHNYIENIGIELTSPSGTKSIITNINSNVLDEELVDAIFLSNAFYGEKSVGQWTLKVIDGAEINADGTSGTSGKLVKWSINISGHIDSSSSDNINPDPVSSIIIPVNHGSLTSSPSLSWTGSTSEDLLRYEYCIGTSPTNCNVYGWASNGTSTSLTITGLNLDAGATYFVNVRTIDTNENSSSVLSGQWKVAWTGIIQKGATNKTVNSSSIATDSLGNVYIAGSTAGSLGATQTGIYDLFVAKYSVIGSLIWTRQLGVINKYTFASGILADEIGNIYLTGYTTGALPGNTQTGVYDAFIAKYNSSGTLLWSKQLGAPGTITSPRGISKDQSGNLYIAGDTNGSLNGNSLTGTRDSFLAKYNQEGNLQWVKQLGAHGDSTYAFAVSSPDSTNVYVSGETRVSLPGNSITGVQDYFLAKYNSSGDVQWIRQSGVASKEVFASSIDIDSNGKVYLAGSTKGAFPGKVMNGDIDYLLVKYDANGTREWIHQSGAGTGYHSLGVSVSIDNFNDVYIVGETNGALPGQSRTGDSDFFVVKLDESGDLKWIRQNGVEGPEITGPRSSCIDSSGYLFITGRNSGSFPGSIDSGDMSYFIARYDKSGNLQ